MTLNFLVNFCILFTCSFFIYIFHVYVKHYHKRFLDLHPYIIGLFAGMAGIILIETTFNFHNYIAIDARTIVIVVAGFFGGPIATIISAVIVGIFRIFVTGLSLHSIIIGLNLISISLIGAYFMKKKPVTIKNVYYYLAVALIEPALIVLFFVLPLNQFMYNSSHLLFYVIILYVFGVVTIYMMNFLIKQFKEMQFVRKLADIDYVTNLANSRKFRSIFQQAIFEQDTLSLLLIDIDQFRQINRIHGHSYGDEILALFANRLKQYVKKVDGYAARVNGEEFYVLFNDAPPAVGIHYAAEILELMQAEPFILSNGSKVSLTVSIGVATSPDNGQTMEEIAQAIDLALLKATELGRNKVVHMNQL